MKRIDAMIEDLATEFMGSGSWGFHLYAGWNGRGFYYFRHPNYVAKITFAVSSECNSEERIKGLLKCELRRRWNQMGYRTDLDYYGKLCLIYADPSTFRQVVRQYLRTRDFKQARLG